MKYAYPALFVKDGEGYLVRFPDFDECITYGDTIAEAIEMAKDVLCLHLYNLEEKNLTIASPTAMDAINAGADEIVSLIACDTMEYRKFYGRQAVKKTVSIPAWLNTMAEKAGISFSSVLQQALKAQLNISD